MVRPCGGSLKPLTFNVAPVFVLVLELLEFTTEGRAKAALRSRPAHVYYKRKSGVLDFIDGNCYLKDISDDISH